jgi:hypothetical protein
MPEHREIVKFAGPGQTPGLIAFSALFVKFRRFPEPLPLLAIVAEDDQLHFKRDFGDLSNLTRNVPFLLNSTEACARGLERGVAGQHHGA